MAFTTLIDTPTLSTRLTDTTLVLVDCRFSLDDPGWGERDYEAAHIPGAVYAHLDRDLSGAKTGMNGRHPLPDPAVFAGALGQLGIGTGMQVVVYDQDSGMYASRLWWMLRWLGHPEVALLDGGFAAWRAEGRPVRGGREARPPRTFDGAPTPGFVADVAEVARVSSGERPGRLLDARAPERFRGDVEPTDPVAGHIPGAANHHFLNNLNANGCFRPAADLRALFTKALGTTPSDTVIAYCGSGVTACHDLLALELAGLRGARLYPGSWSEWCSDPRRPTASGQAG